MAEEAEKENGKLDQILESLDLLFSRLTDVGVQQTQMKQQIEKNTETVGQHTAEQQVMAKQIEETGKAVARLTLNQFKYEQQDTSDCDIVSEASTNLQQFHSFSKQEDWTNQQEGGE